MDRGRRTGLRIRQAVGDEFREARLALGLRQEDVGRAADLSPTQVGRIERGVLTSVTIDQLARLAAVLGLDLTVKVYPGGRPLRDQAQVTLLDRFRADLGPSLALLTEVPVPIMGDRRAWDAQVVGGSATIGVEAETRLRDAQAVLRRIALKKRDSNIDVVILLLADSRTNRAAARDAETSLRAMFPTPPREALRALRQGSIPRASALLIL